MNKIKQILKNKFRSGLKTLPYLLIAILVGFTAVYAGNLTPPGTPAKTMKSLSDLYELIDTGANTPSTDFTTPVTVASTMNSLNDIYDLLTTKISDIDPATIVTGTTIFGVEGEATAGGSYGIPQTGQDHCNAYSSDYGSSSQIPCVGTNQDGDLQNGVALSYTDNTDGTITDNSTGLMWQKCADDQDSLTCAGTANTFLLDDGNGVSPAINYCENLSLATHTDWHLPNIKQLQSIVDYSEFGPSINITYFPGTSSASYWSSTAYEDDTGFAWIVDFIDGYVNDDDMSVDHFVRCVRE